MTNNACENEQEQNQAEIQDTKVDDTLGQDSDDTVAGDQGDYEHHVEDNQTA